MFKPVFSPSGSSVRSPVQLVYPIRTPARLSPVRSPARLSPSINILSIKEKIEKLKGLIQEAQYKKREWDQLNPTKKVADDATAAATGAAGGASTPNPLAKHGVCIETTEYLCKQYYKLVRYRNYLVAWTVILKDIKKSFDKYFDTLNKKYTDALNKKYTDALNDLDKYITKITDISRNWIETVEKRKLKLILFKICLKKFGRLKPWIDENDVDNNSKMLKIRC